MVKERVSFYFQIPFKLVELKFRNELLAIPYEDDDKYFNTFINLDMNTNIEIDVYEGPYKIFIPYRNIKKILLEDENISEELYEQEKENYPVLYYTLVEYNGKEFSVKVRQSDKQEMERTETFKALSYFKGDMPEGAKYSSYERYVLVNDASLKWEDIDRGMFSSQSDAWIEHIVLYQTYK